MKILSQKKALRRLTQIREGLRSTVVEGYENRAKSCLTCETPGSCCLDEHFVNVHVSRLEAAAINGVIDRLPEQKRSEIYCRIDEAIDKYGLQSDGDTYSRTFACPLFEKGAGCLVHREAKPLPCITHACYERAADLPPDDLLTACEDEVELLNRRTYGSQQPLEPLPLAITHSR
jgi:hypothetical protein